MIREVEEHRAYTAREIERWSNRGDITHDQAERLLADMEAHLEDVEPPPYLAPSLVTIYDAWQDLGRPAAVIHGLAGGIIDSRGQLYIARLAWLDEHRCTDPDDRDAVVGLWSTLDQEEISLSLKATTDSSDR